MADGLERLRELVEHVARASNPEAALRALSAMRGELEGAELAEAARALANGSSFGAIARALGISRQAAHRRYRHLAGAEPPPDPRSRGRVVVSNEARAAVAYAREEAVELGVGTIGSEHLLLGVLRCERAPVTALLRELGVDLETARERAQVTIERGLPEVEALGRAAPKGISSYAKKVFAQALQAASDRGDGYVGVEHLVYAAMQDPDGGAVRTLEALGIARDTVYNRLAQ